MTSSPGGGRARRVLGVVGPTASGKSELAIGLAPRLGERMGARIEIVSCDAFQVYRGLDVGAGKVPVGERAGIPHHMVDVFEPDDEVNAARYAEEAARAIRGVWSRAAIPMVVGGSGLYFRALRDGIFRGQGRNEALRARLTRAFDHPRGAERLMRMLERHDPESARRIHRNDRVRLVRALEVVLVSGEPISSLQRERRPPLPDARWTIVGLDPPRDALAERIVERVRGMFAGGLPDEARRLESRFGSRWAGRAAIGYREVLSALARPPAERGTALAEAEAAVATATRRYAKRQLTWFRAERNIVWLKGFGSDPAIVSAALAHLP